MSTFVANCPVLRHVMAYQVTDADGEITAERRADAPINFKEVGKDLVRVALAVASVFTLGYFASLSAMAANIPYVGTWVGRFMALPALSQMAIFGVVSVPALMLGLGASLAASGVVALVAAVKAQAAFMAFNALLQVVTGAVLLSKWNAIQVGVLEGGVRDTLHFASAGYVGAART